MPLGVSRRVRPVRRPPDTAPSVCMSLLVAHHCKYVSVGHVMYVVRKPACSAALGWHMNTTAANIKSSCSRLLTATPKSRVFLGKYATWNLWLIRGQVLWQLRAGLECSGTCCHSCMCTWCGVRTLPPSQPWSVVGRDARHPLSRQASQLSALGVGRNGLAPGDVTTPRVPSTQRQRTTGTTISTYD